MRRQGRNIRPPPSLGFALLAAGCSVGRFVARRMLKKPGCRGNRGHGETQRVELKLSSKA